MQSIDGAARIGMQNKLWVYIAKWGSKMGELEKEF